MAGSQAFRFDPGTLTVNLQSFDSRADRAITAAMVRHSQSGLAYARQNAPWTDRTTNARNGLAANVVRDAGRSYALVFFHSVPYGIWLEVRFGGRYQILRPTIDQEGPKLMQTLSGLFARM